MYWIRLKISLFCFLLSFGVFAQQIDFNADSIMLRKIYSESLNDGVAYSELHDLCKRVGDRLSGSLGAKMAVQWAQNTLHKYDFDSVYLQPVMVSHWERGTREECYYVESNGTIHPLTILALGGSVGTNGILQGELIMFKTLKALEEADPKEVKGKIVFVAQSMDQTIVDAFHAYGKAYPIRGHSAVAAALKGAKAVITRSLSLSENDFPNTGTMSYSDTVKRIPATTVSTQDATALENYMDTCSTPPTLYIKMGCKWFPDVKSLLMPEYG